jgi:hypothetical protein
VQRDRKGRVKSKERTTRTCCVAILLEKCRQSILILVCFCELKREWVRGEGQGEMEREREKEKEWEIHMNNKSRKRRGNRRKRKGAYHTITSDIVDDVVTHVVVVFVHSL